MVDNANYAGQQLAAVGGGHLFLAIHAAIRSNAEALAPCRGFFHAYFQSLAGGAK